jgi:hypothetical protein
MFISILISGPYACRPASLLLLLLLPLLPPLLPSLLLHVLQS